MYIKELYYSLMTYESGTLQPRGMPCRHVPRRQTRVYVGGHFAVKLLNKLQRVVMVAVITTVVQLLTAVD